MAETQETRIQDLEKEIAEKKRELYQLKRNAPEVRVKDYVFTGLDGQPVGLSELFGNQDQLIVVHNMGQSCSYCTMWADGFNGIFGYLQEKAGFALTSPDPPEVQKKFRNERGWQFPIVSTEGTTFKRDMGFENDKGQYGPGASVFRKDSAGTIYHCNDAEFGPGDDFCSVWPFYDLLPLQQNES
ncbi:MAG TPA: DUF899 family protein [Bacillales bacterium]|nr:DUF899 family protein [Bacillales bacterium]